LDRSYFQDPETGKFYQPKSTFIVEGNNLEDLFVEMDDSYVDELEEIVEEELMGEDNNG